MGINVTEEKNGNKILFNVSIDLTHHDGVDMSKENNPTVFKINDIDIYSIFRRRRLSINERDGNPLIYALKSKHPYQIDQTNTDNMWSAAQNILSSWECPWEPTAVMAVPSSHNLNYDLADKISNFLQINHIRSDMIEKKMISEVIADIEDLLNSDLVPQDDIRPLKKQLGLLNTVPQGKSFQMKRIDVSMRPYFSPWKLKSDLKVLVDQQILLVDDLIATGASVTTCAKFIQQNGYNVVGGMSLFSPLDRKIKSSRHKKQSKHIA